MRRRFIRILPAATLMLLTLGVPSAQAVPPTIDQLAFSKVTTTSALLEAEINPQGKKTEYHFEYGTGNCSSNPCISIPVPDKELPAGTVAEPVSAEIEGLAPATTYHFRLIAKSKGVGGGETISPDKTLTTHHLLPPFEPCPNDALRKGRPSANLPDCRAYEQASPVEKNGGDARGTPGYTRASVNGDAISFLATTPIPGADGSQEVPSYLATRSPTGWSTRGMLPPQSSGEAAFVLGWTPDFSQVFDLARRYSGVGGGSLLSLGADGSISPIVPLGGGLSSEPSASIYAGASADGSEVFFESPSKLSMVPAAIEGKFNLYVWDRDTNTLTLAGVLNDESPDGIAPPDGTFAGPYSWAEDSTNRGGASFDYYVQDQHAVTADGSVYFTAAKTGQLYLRRNPTKAQSPLNGEGKCTDSALACTIHVSATQKDNGIGSDGTDPAGTRPAAFMEATPDGSKVFLTSSEMLTNDSNTGPELPPPSIARANLADGSGADLDFLPAKARGLTVSGEHIYWADPVQGNPGEGNIGRAKLNGSGAATEVEPEFITGAYNPQYVTVDGEYVYWTNAADRGKEHGTIGKAELDGDNPNQELIPGASNPQGIDAEGEYLYWGNAGPGAFEGAVRSVGRAKLDGDEADQEFIDVGGSERLDPQGLAVNASHIYMVVSGSNPDSFTYLRRFDIDGDPESQKGLFAGIDNPDGSRARGRGLAIDDTYVYWTREARDTIDRAKLDFTERQLGFIADAEHPYGLALDSSHIYWSANQGSPPNPGNDLYRFDVATGKLTDLAPDPGSENGAEVLGVLGTSEDGSHVYFAANGDLDGKGPAQEGDCKKAVESFQHSGKCSLYLAHEGTIDFIALLDTGKEDEANWQPRRVGGISEKESRVSPDGETLLFTSRQKLTSYENEGTLQLYRYRVGDPAPTCISCNPTGASPREIAGFGTDLKSRVSLSTIDPPEWSYTLSRNLSADGDKVFFETTESLVAADTNGEGGCPLLGHPTSFGRHPVCLDVYEWEAKGTGSCKVDVQGGGCLYLLSTGKSTDASYFFDASASGEDVFFLTRSQLVGQDQDQLLDVYDANVDGGLASQDQAAPIPCEAEGCRPGASDPPPGESAGSAAFSGPADPKGRKPKPRCPKSKRRVRSKGKTRCVAKGRKRAAKSKGRMGR